MFAYVCRWNQEKQPVSSDCRWGRTPKHRTNIFQLKIQVAERRLRLVGHCLRHPEEIVINLVTWQHTIGCTKRGRKTTTFVDAPKKDTELDDIQESKAAAMDRRTWTKFHNFAHSKILSSLHSRKRKILTQL